MMDEEQIKKIQTELRIFWTNNGFEKFDRVKFNLYIGREKFVLSDKGDLRNILRVLQIVLENPKKSKIRIERKIAHR